MTHLIDDMTDEDVEDIRRVIALCFRGLDYASDLDIERILSFDMEWLSPEDAETAVSKLMDKGWLIGDRDSLSPAFSTMNITTPIGWYPRPSRLTQPVDFNDSEPREKSRPIDDNKTRKESPKQKTSTAENKLDPREKLANRLKKYIARQSEITIEEINRRTARKQKALTYASNWLCLALVAREQDLAMEQIVSALSS